MTTPSLSTAASSCARAGDADAEASYASDAAEAAHMASVLAAFRGYSARMSCELQRRHAHYAALPADVRARLPAAAGTPRTAALAAAIAANQAFFDDLVAAQGETAPAAVAAAAAVTPSAGAASKVRSTLAQLCRDWSAEGAPERAAAYAPVLAELAARLPAPARVLVPGCGTGRLVFDAACAGYDAQGCDFSLQMLFASDLVLNGGAAAGAWTLHPWIHDPSNHASAADMLRGVAVPDVDPADVLAAARPHGADLSMAGGDFCAIYSTAAQKGAWDAILGVFFIDTAPVVTEFFDVMRHALRPGGLIILLGPLQWHWQAADDEEGGERDARYERSVELPYEDVRHALEASGFRVLKEQRDIECTYAANARALQRNVFRCVLTVCERLADGVDADPDAAAAAAASAALAAADLSFLAAYCRVAEADAAGQAALRARAAAAHSALLADGDGGRALYRCVRTARWLAPQVQAHAAYAAARAEAAAAPGARWLDVGCGAGADVRRVVADGWPRAAVLAVDVTRALWEAGLAAFGDGALPPATFHLADAAALPFLPALPRRSVRVLSATAVLHTLAVGGADRLLRGACELLEPGGLLLGSCVGTRAAAPRAWPTPNGAGAAQRWLLTHAALQDALHAACFEAVDVTEADTHADMGGVGAGAADLCLLSFSARAPAAGTFLAGMARDVAEAAPLLADVRVEGGGDSRLRALAVVTRDVPAQELRVTLSASGGAVCGGGSAGSLHELLMVLSAAYRADFSAAVAARL